MSTVCCRILFISFYQGREMINKFGIRKHRFKLRFFHSSVIFLGVLFFFSAGFAPAQEAPCLQLRSGAIEFVNLSDPTATAACRNLRRQAGSVTENLGIDDFTIAGVVRHQNGVPLSGVTMTLEILTDRTVRTLVTGDDGTYFFNGLQITDRVKLTPARENYEFTPQSFTVDIVRDVVRNFVASGPPPPPPAPPANQPTLAWTSYYDNPLPPGSMSPPNADYNAMMARDAAGNVFVAGTSHREYFSQNGNTDISIFKTDAFGNRLWARTFNGPGDSRDGAVDLAVDPAGNAYVAGFADVSNGSGSDYDYVVLKYDPDGNLLWSKYYSGTGGSDMPSSLKVDASGNAYVTGFSWGNFANYATVKYDADGNRMWARRYTGGFGEMATEVELDAQGNVYVTGFSGHSVAGDAEDFLTVKYSPTGKQLWFNRYNASPGDGNDHPEEIEIDAEGNLIVVGLSDNFRSAYTVIQKINGASGATVWAEDFNAATGANLKDEPYAMKLDADGNIIMAGQIRTDSNSDFDTYVAKLDAAAAVQWIKVYDGPGNNDYDGDPKLALDAGGNIYVGITSEGFANYDLQIIKYLPDGETDWTYRFDNPYHTNDYFIKWINDNAQTNIFVDEDGGVYAAGESLMPGQSYNLTVFKLEPNAAGRGGAFDFDGDGKADISVFRPETGVWYVLKSSDGSFSAVQWGLATDRLAPADFDGDGKTDYGIFRDGLWYVLNSSDGSYLIGQFGLKGDKPIPADFDNDGRADLSVFRQGIWYTLNSSNNSFAVRQFGQADDLPIPSDYDSNRRSDLAVFRGGVWSVEYQAGLPTENFYFGLNPDIPVPADYDGDKQTDHAVYRDGVWYVWQSATASLKVFQWGIGSDIPVPADYDGDGKTDFAVYREGFWYIYKSADDSYSIHQFGIPTDIPAASVQNR
jgi:hypothetical protein